jgi:ribosomal protein L18E
VRPGQDIKVLGAGRLKRKLAVEAHAFSNSARETIEKAGGSVKVLGEPKAPSPHRGEGLKEAKPTESASPQAE